MNETKFHFNERRHVTHYKVDKFLSLKPESIVLGESIRGHYEEKFSLSNGPRGIRIVEGRQEYSKDFVDRGKKYLELKETPSSTFSPSVRQFHGTANLPSEAATKLSKEWSSKSRVTAIAIKSNDYNLENIMNRKQRIPSLDQRRNNVPLGNEGDKYYKDADRERDFYKTEGLISGSTIALKKSGKIELRKTDDFHNKNSSSITFGSRLTYKEKQKKNDLDDDLQQLRALNNISLRLGQEVPSWEKRYVSCSRCGMHIAITKSLVFLEIVLVYY